MNTTQTFIVRITQRQDLGHVIGTDYLQFLLQESNWIDAVSIEAVQEISLTNQQGDK
jgi:hypothetical protein